MQVNPHAKNTEQRIYHRRPHPPTARRGHCCASGQARPSPARPSPAAPRSPPLRRTSSPPGRQAPRRPRPSPLRRASFPTCTTTPTVVSPPPRLLPDLHHDARGRLPSLCRAQPRLPMLRRDVRSHDLMRNASEQQIGSRWGSQS